MGSFLQTEAWAAFKAKYGWQPHRLEEILVLSRPILLGHELWYAPETELVDEGEIRSLLGAIKRQAWRAFAFRHETAVPFSEELAERFRELGFRKSFESVQPEWRAVLDVRPGEEQLLSDMHQKGRYNIRVADRHGVTVEQLKSIDSFYRLYTETAKRDRFSSRSQEYFEDFVALIPGTMLFVASLKREPLAAALVVFHGQTASYLYGASSSRWREVMAPYALHWGIIREAKRRGCSTYDLGEIPPEGKNEHPLLGLGEFKMKFGARPVHIMGSWDYVLQPSWYAVFRAVEKVRRGFRA